MPVIEWKFGPNALNYIHSTAQIVALFGPPGSQKTFASIQAILAHQQRCGTSIRIAIIRDTLENIRISVVPSILEFFEGATQYVKFSNENKQLQITVAGGFTIDADLFGCNDPADLQRLQGASSWSLIWINDPAPMTDRGNAGVPEVVYDHAAYRSTRKSNSPSRLQVDMNYAEETHWTYRRLILEPDDDPETPLIHKRVFHVSYREMQALNEEAMQMAQRVFSHDPTAKARYVEGRFAEFKPGKEVAPGYKRHIHLSPHVLWPGTGLECFAFCDGWHNPSCVLGQITTERRLIYIDTVRLEGSDISTLLETQVGPLLRSPKWNNKWRSWRIGGDRSMMNRDQGNINHTAAQDVEKFFAQFDHGIYKPRFEGGPVFWSEIERTFNYWLVHPDHQNRPMIYLSASNHLLDKGLNGAWHFKIDNSGNIQGTEPVKDEMCVDAQTEILTMDGWKSESELSGGEPIYGYDMNLGKLVEANIISVNRFNSKQYNVIHYDSQMLDMMVTPNHNCIAKRRTNTRDKANGGYKEIKHNFEFVKAQDLHSGHGILYVASQHESLRHPKNREFSNEFVKLCAWVMTEGSYRKDGSILITQSVGHNPQYINEISYLLSKYPTSTHAKQDVIHRGFANRVWRIYRETAILIRQMMPNKYPSPEFINKMTQTQKRIFLYEAIKGDGDWGPEQTNLKDIKRNRDFWTKDKTPRICTRKKEEADSMQHMATLIGMKSTINKGGNSYKVSLVRRGVEGGRGQKPIEEQVPFVWCPTTTTGTWIARRNGKPFITGNSHTCDAWANSVCVLLGKAGLQRVSAGALAQQRLKQLRRVQSYAVQGGGRRG